MNCENPKYRGEVRDVFSGDDLVVMVDLGAEDLWKRQRVRLHGVDTPNGMSSAPGSSAGQIRTYVRNLVKGKKVRIEVVKRTTNSWVSIVVVETPTGDHNLNEDLIAKGFKHQHKG